MGKKKMKKENDVRGKLEKKKNQITNIDPKLNNN